MRNKAFTLVELLTVIIILGLVLIISSISINKTIVTSKEKAYNEQKNRIISLAKTWATINVNELPLVINEYIIISMDDLKDESLIIDDVKNPLNNQIMNGCVKVTLEENNYSYQYLDDCLN